MQEEKKKMIKNAIAKVVTKLRGSKSQFMLGAENDISTSILSNIEKGKKDPQLTTLFRLAGAFGISAPKFVKLISDELPKDFSFVEK